MSDHVGRKPLLIVSQIGTLIGFLVTAFAGTLWVVFLGRIIDGATAGNLSLAQAYISDVTKPEERAKSFGVIGIAFGLGFLIGPAISGFLSQFDYRMPIFAAALMSFTSILATTFLLPSVANANRVQGGPSGPGGRRLSLVQWGEYGRYFKQPGLGRAAGAVPDLHAFFRHVRGGAGAVRGAPAHLARQTVWSRTDRLRVGLRGIPGGLPARAGPGTAGQTLRRARA